MMRFRSSFNSFTGFHKLGPVLFLRVVLFHFQFLHRIPQLPNQFPLAKPSRSFNSFTGFHPARRRRHSVPIVTFNSFTGFHEVDLAPQHASRASNFQFLHRIPLGVAEPALAHGAEYFQFLHRIPLTTQGAGEMFLITFNSFTGFHLSTYSIAYYRI